MSSMNTRKLIFNCMGSSSSRLTDLFRQGKWNRSCYHQCHRGYCVMPKVRPTILCQCPRRGDELEVSGDVGKQYRLVCVSVYAFSLIHPLQYDMLEKWRCYVLYSYRCDAWLVRDDISLEYGISLSKRNHRPKH